MDKLKRRLSFNEFSIKKLRNKFNQNNISTTCIENLSNELFYEIFDYLDGCDLHKAFSNLNHRFQEFLNRSSLLYKIKFNFTSDELFLNNHKQVRFLNKHQIYSIHLWSELHIDQFFSSFIIDSSLDRLESIFLRQIKRDTLAILLKKLICLPRLFSLNIQSYHIVIDLCDVYQSIFALPMIKFLKVNSYEFASSVSLPIAIKNQQCSTIKHLIIAHCCTFNELDVILSYTPEVTHLNFFHVSENDPHIGIISPMILANLTYVSMDVIFLNFAETEILFKKLSSKVKVLRFKTRSHDENYLVSDRWERLILQHFPYLEEFYLEYYEFTDCQYEHLHYCGECDPLNTPFWIERQWIFEVDIEFEEIGYLTKPYKKRWYESVNIKTDRNINISTMLTIMYIPFDDYLETLLLEITWVTAVATIYHLQYFKTEIFIGVLMEIINILPDLDSLKVWSLSLIQSTCLSVEKLEDIRHVSSNNKITKVYLENMIKFEEVLFLIDLFPLMKYLQVGCTSSIDIQLLVRVILIKTFYKSNHYLRLLAVIIPTADDEMMGRLQNMIDFEKLLFSYTIKRVSDTIYLQWE